MPVTPTIGRTSRRAAINLGIVALVMPTIGSAQALPVLLIAGVPEDSATPVLWAQQRDIFRKHGIEVRLDGQRSGSAVAAGVAGGTYSMGKSGLTSIITAHARGIPFVLVAPGGLYLSKLPTLGLLASMDMPIGSGASFNGKTLAVSSLNDIATIATRHWIDDHGGDSSTVKFLEFPMSAVTEAIIAGRVTGGAIVVPDLERGLETHKVKVVGWPYDAIGSRFMYTGWFTTVDYAKAHRGAIAEFAAALREAATYTNAHPQQTIDLLAKFTSTEPAIIAKMARVQAATALDPQLIQPVIDACAKYKLIDAPFDAGEMIFP